MHAYSTLMLVESIERERYESARRRPRHPAPPKPEPPRRASVWSQLTQAYRLGFAAKP